MVSLVKTKNIAAFDQMNYCIPTNSKASFSSGDEFSGVRKIIHRNGMDFVRQPCKARGINVKDGEDMHIAKFAYIDIPVSAVHGTILSCCHRVCNTSGRRFRYCVRCQTAVARRNFNVRHAHGNTRLPPSLGKAKEEAKTDSPSSSARNARAEDSIHLDHVETTVPSFISIDGTERANSPFHEPDGTMFPLYVTRGELEVIAILRSRPGHNFAGTWDEWSREIRRLADMARKGMDSAPISPYGRSSIRRGEFQNFAPHDINICTSGDDQDINKDTCATTSDFDGVDLASFFDA